MFDGKPRIGVIQQLQLYEFEAAERGVNDAVIWVCKHKIGDKQPATIVIDNTTMAQMDR